MNKVVVGVLFSGIAHSELARHITVVCCEAVRVGENRIPHDEELPERNRRLRMLGQVGPVCLVGRSEREGGERRGAGEMRRDQG